MTCQAESMGPGGKTSTLGKAKQIKYDIVLLDFLILLNVS